MGRGCRGGGGPGVGWVEGCRGGGVQGVGWGGGWWGSRGGVGEVGIQGGRL